MRDRPLRVVVLGHKFRGYYDLDRRERARSLALSLSRSSTLTLTRASSLRPFVPSSGAYAGGDGLGASDDDASSSSSSSSSSPAPPPFQNLERMLVKATAPASSSSSSSSSSPFEKVSSSFVLRPPAGTPPSTLVHFIGGAFVGAAPQLLYRKLLEELSARGAVVVATPYSTSFDHLRTVDEIFFEYSRVLKALAKTDPAYLALPCYGVGHSLGSLLHVLMCSRYVVVREGNCLMSFNNKPATDSIPLLSPMIAPSVRMLGPVLSQIATSPLRSQAEGFLETIRDSLPMDDAVKSGLLPVLDQLTPIFLDVSTGTQEFTPSPEESRGVIRDGYGVPKNLLIRFTNDTIDETPTLASILQSCPCMALPSSEITIKTLEGDHTSPLAQDLSRQLGMDDAVRDSFVEFTSQRMAESESFWSAVGRMEGLPSVVREVAGLGEDLSRAVGSGVDEEKAMKGLMEAVEEVGAFIDGAEVRGGGRLLGEGR